MKTVEERYKLLIICLLVLKNGISFNVRVVWKYTYCRNEVDLEIVDEIV